MRQKCSPFPVVPLVEIGGIWGEFCPAAVAAVIRWHGFPCFAGEAFAEPLINF